MTVNEIYLAAGMTEDDIRRMPSYIEGEDEFYGSEAYGKLYDYFTDEIPYSVQKCRDDTPDNWIIDYISACN